MVRTLAVVYVLAGLMIVFAVRQTTGRIADNRHKRLEQAILRVVPGAFSRVTFQVVEDRLVVLEGGTPAEAEVVYATYSEDGSLAGIAIPAAGQGYADKIQILYAYDPQRQAIVGMTVLASKETPGLGDRIASEPEYLANFVTLDVTLVEDGSRLAHPVEFVKSGSKINDWQVDGISGATISSRAVADMINKSAGRLLPVLAANREVLENGGK
jgi:electron transport complex protein RnfG